MSIFDNVEIFGLYKEYISNLLLEQLKSGTFIKIKLLYKQITIKGDLKNSVIRPLDYSFEDIQDNIYKKDGSRMIFIHGPYGAGKSTLLLKLVEQNLISNRIGEPIFIYCDLSKIEGRISHLLKSLKPYSENAKVKFLEELLKCSRIPKIRFDDPKVISNIYKDIIEGKLVLFLDAIDEGLLTQNIEVVKDFTNAVFDLLITKKASAKSKLIISNRSEWNINSYIPSLGLINKCAAEYVSRIDIVQILNLNYWNIEEYVKTYYKIPNNEAKVSVLQQWLNTIKNSIWAGDLAKNPMHLNMLCSIDLLETSEKISLLGQRSKYELFRVYVTSLLKKSIVGQSFLIKLAKECMISGKLYASRGIDDQWENYDLDVLRKLPILRCEERPSDSTNEYRVGFFHKSFLDYFFAIAAQENLSTQNRDLFDKIELDIDGRDFLVDLMGEEMYITQTRVGWGLPFLEADINPNSCYRIEISNQHRQIVKAILNPDGITYLNWKAINDLIVKCLSFNIITKEPQIVRTLRYGLVVLKQILDSQQNWSESDNDEACRMINNLIFQYFSLIIELNKKSIKRILSNKITIENLQNFHFLFIEEMNLLASTTLKTLLNHIYLSKISAEDGNKLYYILQLASKNRIIPNKTSIAGYSERLDFIKKEVMESLRSMNNYS